jgi:hypothetical protein
VASNNNSFIAVSSRMFAKLEGLQNRDTPDEHKENERRANESWVSEEEQLLLRKGRFQMAVQTIGDRTAMGN